MSVHFECNLDVMHIDRTSYDFLNMMGDVGGVLEILNISFKILVSSFALLRIQTIFASRLI